MIISLFALALNIIAISDVLSSHRRSLGEKIILIVLIIAVPIVASGIYLLAFREQK